EVTGRFAIRRPFLYPVNGPDGIALTEFGKPHDPTGSHDHHYSLWVAHTSVNGHDFWSEKGGVIVHKRFDQLEDGPVYCRLVQSNGWVFGGKEVLQERRSLTVYRPLAAFRLMDIELELTPPKGEAVTFGKSSFGLLAVRVAQSMSVFDGGGEILTGSGHRNEREAHLKRACWLDQSGPVAPGKWGGIAIFDHAENVNHPTGWHCRNDGWAGAAFALDGPYTIKAGEQLRLRYRILLHRGSTSTGEVAHRYEEYRTRPTVRVGEPAAID
ncbi:MAG TPA: PmoA family protein, partial [Gemmataceae bacterium]|nr:PmoA family protein [Gemmataceae bacterium]